MSNSPLARPTAGGPLRAVAGAWNRFWFTPADPTTLGFMRVCTGLLALWVHLVYSYDLFAYFGRGSWLDPRALDYMRYHVPYYTSADGWTESDQEEANRLRQLQRSRPLTEPEQRRFNDLQGVLEDQDRQAAELQKNWAEDLEKAGALWVAQARQRYAEARAEPSAGAATPEARKKRFDAARAQMQELSPWMEHLEEEWKLLHPKKWQALHPDQPVPQPTPQDNSRLEQLEARLHLREAEGLWEREDSGATLTPEEQAALNELEPRLWEVEKARPWTEADQQRLDVVELRLHDYADRTPFARGQFLWSVYFHVQDPAWIIAVHVCVLVIFLLYTLGVGTRVTSALAWMAALCYVQRLPNHLFGMDTMMCLLLFYLMIGPSGAALSIDRLLVRWRDNRRPGRPALAPARPQPSVMAGFALRLVQVNFCIIYFAAGTSKLMGDAWWNGTAIWLCMANASFAPMHVWVYDRFLVLLCQHRWLWEIFLTGSVIFTLFTELGFPFLVWNKRLRWVMVSCSVMLHLGIGLIMGLVVFSLFMMVMVVSFVPPEAVRAQLQRLGDQTRRLFRRGARPEPSPGPPSAKAEELVLSRS
jgi:hypothetical protein